MMLHLVRTYIVVGLLVCSASLIRSSFYSQTCQLYPDITVIPQNYQPPTFQSRNDIVFIVDYTPNFTDFDVIKVFLQSLINYLRTNSVVVIHPDSTHVSVLVIGGNKLLTFDGISSDDAATNACVFNDWISSSLVYPEPTPGKTYSLLDGLLAAEKMFAASQSSSRAVLGVTRVVWVISGGVGAFEAKNEFTKLKFNSTLSAQVFATGVAGNGLISNACCDSTETGYGVALAGLTSGQQNYFTCLPAWMDFFTSLQLSTVPTTSKGGYKSAESRMNPLAIVNNNDMCQPQICEPGFSCACDAMAVIYTCIQPGPSILAPPSSSPVTSVTCAVLTCIIPIVVMVAAVLLSVVILVSVLCYRRYKHKRSAASEGAAGHGGPDVPDPPKARRRSMLDHIPQSFIQFRRNFFGDSSEYSNEATGAGYADMNDSETIAAVADRRRRNDEQPPPVKRPKDNSPQPGGVRGGGGARDKSWRRSIVDTISNIPFPNRRRRASSGVYGNEDQLPQNSSSTDEIVLRGDPAGLGGGRNPTTNHKLFKTSPKQPGGAAATGDSSETATSHTTFTPRQSPHSSNHLVTPSTNKRSNNSIVGRISQKFNHPQSSPISGSPSGSGGVTGMKGRQNVNTNIPGRRQDVEDNNDVDRFPSVKIVRNRQPTLDHRSDQAKQQLKPIPLHKPPSLFTAAQKTPTTPPKFVPLNVSLNRPGISDSMDSTKGLFRRESEYAKDWGNVGEYQESSGPLRGWGAELRKQAVKKKLQYLAIYTKDNHYAHTGSYRLTVTEHDRLAEALDAPQPGDSAVRGFVLKSDWYELDRSDRGLNAPGRICGRWTQELQPGESEQYKETFWAIKDGGYVIVGVSETHLEIACRDVVEKLRTNLKESRKR